MKSGKRGQSEVPPFYRKRGQSPYIYTYVRMLLIQETIKVVVKLYLIHFGISHYF